MLQVEWQGMELFLHPARAVYWPSKRTVAVSDTHFGKDGAFRAWGIPVPGGVTGEAMVRLDALMADTRAERLVVLGDFFHAREGRSARLDGELAAWRNRHRELDIVVVRGNHDRHAGDPAPGFQARVYDDPWRETEGEVSWRHIPEPDEGRPVFAGHTHPCVRLREGGGSTLRLPCFHASGHILTLPAFGMFTGMKAIRRARGDRVWVVGGDHVVQAPMAGGR